MTLTLLPESVYTHRKSSRLGYCNAGPLAFVTETSFIIAKLKMSIDEPISEYGTILFMIDSSIIPLNIQRIIQCYCKGTL